MLATLSRWRRGFKSHRGRLFGTVRNPAKRRSSNLRVLWVRLPPVLLEQYASAEHWRAQVAVTHPPSGIGGSTPSRRTRSRTARSSSGSGCWPLKPATRVQIPHGSLTWPSGATGRHATLRTSCPYGLGSSTLPLVTAGGAGARLAFIRPGCPDRYRGLQLQPIIAGGPALSGVS